MIRATNMVHEQDIPCWRCEKLEQRPLKFLLLGHFLSQLFFTRQNLLHVLLPLFLLTTSITTILPLDVNADSINHFESVWNDVRDALSKGRWKMSLLTLFRFHRYPRHHGWQSTSGGPERSDTRTYVAVSCVGMSMKGPKKSQLWDTLRQ